MLKDYSNKTTQKWNNANYNGHAIAGFTEQKQITSRYLQREFHTERCQANETRLNEYFICSTGVSLSREGHFFHTTCQKNAFALENMTIKRLKLKQKKPFAVDM